MREIVLDTETTGLEPTEGHRIVELGCLELENHVPTGRSFRAYLDPEREVPAAAFEVHGLSGEFLAKQPRFAEVCDDFLGFLADSPLVIHNAGFDLGFVNAELARAGRPALEAGRVTDTLELARRRFPGAPAGLDALCRRFGIDLSGRQKHGALVDAGLLAKVYLELVGGRQAILELAASAVGPRATGEAAVPRPPRPHAPTPEELQHHEALLDSIVKPIWRS